ncbi:MAG: glycosyl transferase group 1, partial [Mucilaginibacter sp.]|nr:glycosyl transferase group 1 [Mucilaginibacter sp.]
CVEHKSFVAYDDLPKVFSGADFLILPYDFSPKSIQFIGYSMPTKATEYMISGTPVIIFAPEQTALVSYAKKHQWAKIVTDNNVTTLSEAITSLIQNKAERQKLAQTAIMLAENNHSLSKVTSEFRNILSSLTN